MDTFSKEILKQVVGEDVAPPKAAPRRSPMDHWSRPVLMERAAYLRKMAKLGNGAAGEMLKEYPQHAAMLSYRDRNGEAEVHARFADLFYVLDGTCTLVTGGTVLKAKTTEPGEIRGDAIEGGILQELRAGDLAHVPAGLPHQMLVGGEKTVTYFVLKIQEEA